MKIKIVFSKKVEGSREGKDLGEGSKPQKEQRKWFKTRSKIVFQASSFSLFSSACQANLFLITVNTFLTGQKERF